MSMSVHQSDVLQTPLATAVGLSDILEVKRILTEEKAASTVFVQGSTINSILCTLPNAPKPRSSVITHQLPLQYVPDDIIDAIDNDVCTYLNSLPQIDNSNEDELSFRCNDKTAIEGYRIGDIVALLPTLATSSLVAGSKEGSIGAAEVSAFWWLCHSISLTYTTDAF